MEAANSYGGKNSTLILFCLQEHIFSFSFTCDMALHNTPKCEKFSNFILKQLLPSSHFPLKS